MIFKYQIRVRLIIPYKNKLLLEYVTDEDFYFYPGGRVENYETIKEASEREVKEEMDANFKFNKVLYIREFIIPNEEHSLELFILGELDNYNIEKSSNDPDFKPTHEFLWVDINKLPDNLYPKDLTKKIINNASVNFSNPTEYLGKIS